MRNIIIIAVLGIIVFGCNTKPEKEDIKWDEIKTTRDGLDDASFNNKLFVDMDSLLTEWNKAQKLRDHGNIHSAEKRLLDLTRGHFSEVVGGLSEGDEGQKIIASAALGFCEDIRAIPYLLSALNDQNEEVRRNSAMSVGSIGYADTPHEALFGALGSEQNDNVRGMIYFALSRIVTEENDHDALPVLIKGLEEKNAQSRNHALIALAIVGNSSAASTIAEKTLSDKDPTVRYNSIRALGKIGSRSFVPQVKKKLNDPVLPVRKMAAFVLKKWTGEEYDVEFLKKEDSAKEKSE
ncbi:HEAT repeat domain-containing protein [Candidatus Uabimicrobium sp. HlEnr_7]|uniref:HEAT repeat domain-containing protein n=1 Tax=Candidatus Uabimicrobium helgolandensis TaxID=3095367 RepID=UPI0035560558